MSSVYPINKGVNTSLEFKGLKAQYIGYFAALLLALLIGFTVLYLFGLSIYLCIVIVGGSGGYGAFKLYALSHRHGAYGLQKLVAQKRTPKVIRAYTRKIFF
jgi:hypothetical protein